MIEYKELLAKELHNEEFKKEYEALSAWARLQSRLILARKQSGLTQAELADKIGIKQSALSRFENNLESSSLTSLARYCRALGIKELTLSF